MLRIECPTCATAYTADRLGLTLTPEQSALSTVVCLVCKIPFEAWIEPHYIADEPGWFARYILRRQPSKSFDGHVVTQTRART